MDSRYLRSFRSAHPEGFAAALVAAEHFESLLEADISGGDVVATRPQVDKIRETLNVVAGFDSKRDTSLLVLTWQSVVGTFWSKVRDASEDWWRAITKPDATFDLSGTAAGQALAHLAQALDKKKFLLRDRQEDISSMWVSMFYNGLHKGRFANTILPEYAAPMSGRLLEVFKYFVTVWLKEHMGITEPFKRFRADSTWPTFRTVSLANMAAHHGEVHLLRWLHSLGVDLSETQGDPEACPAFYAFSHNSRDGEALRVIFTELGVKPSSRFDIDMDYKTRNRGGYRYMLINAMIENPILNLNPAFAKPGVAAHAEVPAAREHLLRNVKIALEAEPSVVNRWVRKFLGDDEPVLSLDEEEAMGPPKAFEFRILEHSFETHNFALTKMILDAGSTINYSSVAPLDGDPHETREVIRMTTAGYALTIASPEVLEHLLEHHHMLDGWRDKYDIEALYDLSERLVRQGSMMLREKTSREKEQCRRRIEAFLKRGFRPVPRTPDFNMLLATLIRCEAEGLKPKEDDVLAVIKLFHSYGCDLTTATGGVTSKPNGPKFLHYACERDWHKVAAFALDTLKTPIDDIALSLTWEDEVNTVTPLGYCLNLNLHGLARKLIERGARGAIDRVFGHHQAVMYLPGPLMEEEEGLKTLKMLIEREKETLLDMRFYRGYDYKQQVSFGPIARAVSYKKHKILEALLTSGLSHLDEAVNFIGKVTFTRTAPASRMTAGKFFGSAAQIAAGSADWKALSLLLSHSNVQVDAKYQGPLPEGWQPLPSVADCAKAHGCSDRKVLTLIELARRRNQKETAALAAGGASASGTVVLPGDATAAAIASNAFEDPSLKPLTEKEAKAKAKKRAQKKKAKAKKKAVQREANAGAGKPADDSSSDDSSDDDGLDEEERMLASLPIFDLEKETAARQAREQAELAAASKGL